MDFSIPDFPVLHHLPEFAQTHVHWVSDAIQLSHPLSSLSSPVLNLSQHWGLFQWVGSSSHQVAKVLEFQPQHSSFQWTSGLIDRNSDHTPLLPHPYLLSVDNTSLCLNLVPSSWVQRAVCTTSVLLGASHWACSAVAHWCWSVRLGHGYQRMTTWSSTLLSLAYGEAC